MQISTSIDMFFHASNPIRSTWIGFPALLIFLKLSLQNPTNRNIPTRINSNCLWFFHYIFCRGSHWRGRWRKRKRTWKCWKAIWVRPNMLVSPEFEPHPVVWISSHPSLNHSHAYRPELLPLSYRNHGCGHRNPSNDTEQGKKREDGKENNTISQTRFHQAHGEWREPSSEPPWKPRRSAASLRRRVHGSTGFWRLAKMIVFLLPAQVSECGVLTCAYHFSRGKR